MVNRNTNEKNKFYQEFDVILKTKLGWNIIYKKLRIELPLNNQIIKCSNGERYAALDGRQIGTSTPDYIYRIDDVDVATGKTYSQLRDEYEANQEELRKTLQKR